MKSLIEIEQVVCDVFGVTSEFIHEKSRSQKKPIFRYLIAYICREINGEISQYGMIGKHFGNKHSTMIHGLRVVRNEIDTDHKFKADVIECFKRLGEETKLVDEREETKKEIFEILNQVFIDTVDRLHLFNLVNKL